MPLPAFTVPFPALIRRPHPLRHATARRPLPLRHVTPRRPRITPHASQDHYKVLDISPTADGATIKRAYRRAALKNHPDVSDAPDARERFLRVQEAYAVLSDPSKRAAYDRRAASTGAPDIPGFDGFDGFGGFGVGFDQEYVRRWREQNPMPNDIDDSLGSIFSDIFSGVANAVGSNGVVEDFIEFLEDRVEGLGSDDGLADVLKSSDVDILQAELDDANFVLQQLRSRKQRAEDEEKSLRDRAAQWHTRAERADARREYDVRDAARTREEELLRDARRFGDRASKAAKHVRDHERRVRLLNERLDAVKRDAPMETGSQNYERRGGEGRRVDRKERQEQAIDDELDKMKRELGL